MKKLFFLALTGLVGVFSGLPLHLLNVEVPFFKPKDALAAEVLVDNTILDATDEFGPSPTLVFTDDLTGYVFYIDGTAQDLVYKKTTDGGIAWGAPTVIDTVTTGWTNVSIWYDQWTPGDTTGTQIHIAVSDDASDDIFYTNLDTSTDTLLGSFVTVLAGATYTEAENVTPSITKGAGGNLFITANFASIAGVAGGLVSKSIDGGASWSDVTPASWSDASLDQVQLVPLVTGQDIMAIKAATATDEIQYRIYSEVSDTWAGSWTTIAALIESTLYDQWFSATIKKSTGDVYLTFANRSANAANDIEFWSFDESNRGAGFVAGGNLFTNDATVIAPVPVMEEDTGYIYVAYLRGTLNASVGTYFKKSEDGGATWSDESVQLHGPALDDRKSVAGNFLSEDRLGVLYYDDDLNDIFFSTVDEFIEVMIDNTILDGSDEFGPSPTVVFTSSLEGYVFFVDSTGQDFVYRKTSDGGKNWQTSVLIDTTIGGWTNSSIWYDQWTPGDTTGSLIHIAVSEDVTDDIYYTNLDTSGDVLLGTMTPVLLGATYTEAVNAAPSITKGVGGNLFITANFASIAGAAGGLVAKSIDDGASWSDITPASWSDVTFDQIQLLPLLTGQDVIAIKAATATNEIQYRIYSEVSDAWAGAWTTIATLAENATYDQWFSATIKKSTADVYLAFANQITNAANDVEFWSFDESSRGGGFVAGANVMTDNAGVIAPVPVMDENTGDVYVAYLSGTLGTAMGVYYKKSEDGGATWSAESVQLNRGYFDDIRSMSGNLLDQDILYVIWQNDDLDDIMGNKLATLQAVSTFVQAAYRFFENLNSTDVGTPLAAQDVASVITSAAEAFRLRLLIEVSAADLASSGAVFRLQFAEKVSTCDPAVSGESYADVTPSTILAYNDNATPSDGAALTTNANDPLNGGSGIEQTYEESNTFTNSVNSINNGESGLWDFALIENGMDAGQDYCLRVVKSDGSLLEGYNVFPEISLTSALVVDFVTSGGVSVASPTMAFSAVQTTVGPQSSTATLGVNNQRMRVTNPTGNPQWALSIAADDGPTAVWSSGTNFYDFNDPTAGTVDGADADAFGGRMSINPSTGSASPQGGCNLMGITAGSSASFSEGVTDSITLATANSSSMTGCYWDFTGAAVSQSIPGEQAIGSYNIDMTLTVVSI